MGTIKKMFAVMLAAMMVMALACTPEKKDTTHRVLDQAEYYITIAESFVVLSETGWLGDLADENEKVAGAVDSLKKSLIALKTTVHLVKSGIEKDYMAVIVHTNQLISDIIELVAAIQEAASS